MNPDLERWSRPERDPAIVSTIAATFALRASSQPDAAAVVAEGRSVSFAELDAMSLRAAAGLREHGVKRGDLVGAYCKRSPELIAVILGIWRCGGVYVPLDPKYPSQRLKAILADAALPLCVCDAPLPSRLTTTEMAECDAARLCATPLEHVAAEEMAGEVELPQLADRAVVLYTSGSTGTPKGAILTHRNLANHNAYVIRAFDLGPNDRRTAVCSINFDASLEEFFCTLNAGATLVLPEADTLDSFDRFLAFLDRNRITALFMPTSMWRELTNFLYAARREFPESVRLIDLGGERVTRPIYERFLRVGGRRIRWINVYGPTECSIYATTYEHDPVRDASATEHPPIGRPIDNVRLYVLDAEHRLCAPGERGELYIGGAGVGEGYLNRPQLTAERYIESPSPDLPPGRYYRTGDEVCFRADGQLEYIGRLDDQVKLRGFRIEPGEIEATLQRHPAVRDAAVVVRTSTLGTSYLAAYLVLHEGAAWDARSTAEFCRDQLPDYMVPRTFVQLDVLPQSPNGKVAREALPDPCLDEPLGDDSARSQDVASTEWEHRLLGIWRSALGLNDLGLDDNFFDLGGDSLRAMALAAQLEESLGRPVSAALLLSSPTVRQLAAELEQQSGAGIDSLVLVREGDRSKPLFLVHSLGGDVWIYRELVQRMRTASVIYGLQLPGLHVPTTEEAVTFEECAAEHVRRMQSVQPHGPYRIAGYSSGGMLAYEMARQLAERGEQTEFLGFIDAGVPPAFERRFVGSRKQKAAALARNLPLMVRELRSKSFADRWRKILGFVSRGMRKLTARCRPAAASWQAESDWLACFAEDISFFPDERLSQIKRHYEAVKRYEPGAWQGSAELFRVARQPLSAVPTPTLGWEHLVRGDVGVHGVTGTHDSLMQPPHVDQLAQTIDAALDRCDAASATVSELCVVAEA